ncbi:zinc finger CCCH domain-containing protein 7A-like, partial [Clarias magur]
STLPFNGSQEEYELFLQDLVRNLFGEGNDVFCEGDWSRSVEHYTEALGVSEYAESEDINIPCKTRERLYANRAAAYLHIGVHDQALEDCEQALELNENNYRAQYRKARCLKELGRHQEAYDVIAKCSMAVPQDAKVIALTQDLAKILGLKIRKAYVRGKPALNVLPGSSGSGATSEKFPQSSASVEEIEQDECQFTQIVGTLLPVNIPVCPPGSQKTEVEPQQRPVHATPKVISAELPNPEPVPLVMPSVNGSKPSDSYAQLDLDGEILGDDLDELLDKAAPADLPMGIPTVTGPLPLSSSLVPPCSIPAPLPPHPFMSHPVLMAPPCTVTLPAPYHKPNTSVYSFGLDSFPSQLDSLDSLSLSEPQPEKTFPLETGFGQHSFMMGSSERSLPTLPPMRVLYNTESSGYTQELPQPVDLSKNPLAETHEFKLACAVCYERTGPGVLDFSYHPEEHKCKKDLLIGRIKHAENQTWKLIRPRPTKNQYMGLYYICKDVANREECKYPGHCTFAYCQEEIDVWTLERKGLISREMLCDPSASRAKIHLTVSKILQEHQGIFLFLCEVCFDHKPRKISKPGICSHQVKPHGFDQYKCLVHLVKTPTLKYSKIRPYLSPCQLDLCRHAVRYGCQREDFCFFAHSFIELQVWIMQREQGITHEAIVQETKKFWNIENSSREQELQAVLKFGPPNLKLQFVCGQCWRHGQLSEADKNKKYCSAKARHPWSKDRRVVLVSSVERKKWTEVRPLPTRKPAPAQFEICLHVAAGKKCQYIGNCTFAHSMEEKELWTYMKDNNIADMEQLYECWLQSQKLGSSEESSSSVAKENGKQIHMPTDYAEDVAGNHCWLCGKNCNSEKQWQQHITSEKHKDRMFNSEDDQIGWQYRFPTGVFRVCDR